MSRNTQQIVARKQVVKANLAVWQDQRQALTDRMLLQVGEVYTIKQGRKAADAALNTYEEVDAVLVAQADVGGRMMYKFEVGTGFDAKQVVVDAHRIIWAEELPSDLKLFNLIQKAQRELEALDTEYEQAVARENVGAGEEVNVMLGRDTTRRTVPAVVVGQHVDASGVRRFAVVAEDTLQIVNVSAIVFA